MTEEGPNGEKNSKVCKSIQESVVQSAAWRNKKNASVHTELKRRSLKSLKRTTTVNKTSFYSCSLHTDS